MKKRPVKHPTSVYLVPAEQLLRIRDFESCSDARLWADTFNATENESNLVAIVDATEHLRSSAIDARSEAEHKVVLVTLDQVSVAYESSDPEKAERFAKLWNRDTDDGVDLSAVVVPTV